MQSRIVLGVLVLLGCTGPNRLEEVLTGAPIICERYRDKLKSCCKSADAGADNQPQLCKDVAALEQTLGKKDWKDCPLETARTDEFLPCKIINLEATLNVDGGAVRPVASQFVSADLAELSGPGPAGSSGIQTLARVRVVPLGFRPDVTVESGALKCTANHYIVSQGDLPPVAGQAGTIQMEGIAGAGQFAITSPIVCRRGLFANITDRFGYRCANPQAIPPTANFLNENDPVRLAGINDDSTGFLVTLVGGFGVDSSVAGRVEATIPTDVSAIAPNAPMTIPLGCSGGACAGNLHVFIRSTDRTDDATTPDNFGEIDCTQTGGGTGVVVPGEAMNVISDTPWYKVTISVWQANDQMGVDDRGTQITFAPGTGAYAEIIRK